MRRIILLSVLVCVGLPAARAQRQGGYAGNVGTGDAEVVRIFCDILGARTQYYYAYKHLFVKNNDSYVDAVNFAMFSGHGGPYSIQCIDGGVNLWTAGGTSPSEGYGDFRFRYDLDFIAFEACQVIPSPKERSDWWSCWVNDDGIFDGLHMACGFRTNAYFSTDQDISRSFAKQVKRGKAVRLAWFDAICRKGKRGWWPFWARPLKEKGCVVYHPSCKNDVYPSPLPDPPINHKNLCIWWQK